MLVNQNYNSHTVSLFTSINQPSEDPVASSDTTESASGDSSSATYYAVSSRDDKMAGVYTDPAVAETSTSQTAADAVREAFDALYEDDRIALHRASEAYDAFMEALSNASEPDPTLQVTDETFAFWEAVATRQLETGEPQPFDSVDEIASLEPEELAEMLAQQLEAGDVSLYAALEGLGLDADELATSLKGHISSVPSAIATDRNDLSTDDRSLNFWASFASGHFNDGANAIITTYAGDEGMTQEELVTRQIEKDADTQISVMKSYMAGERELSDTSAEIIGDLQSKLPASGTMTDADWDSMKADLIEERRQAYESGETTYIVSAFPPIQLTPLDESMQKAVEMIRESEANSGSAQV